VFVPNIITPNGDGKNDELKIIGLDQGTWVLNIYNRWGKEVYQASDYQHSWNAANLPGGVYFYRLREIKTGQQVKGWIDVIR
jgi:gliding motility-associated-like protein